MYYFSPFYFSCSNSYNVVPLQVGTHKYVDYFNKNVTIETIPIRTMIRGLCYKLKLSNPSNYFMLFAGSSIQSLDKLEKMNLMIATENTWQGLVGDRWPYSKGLKISKGFFMTSRHSKLKSKLYQINGIIKNEVPWLAMI